MYLLLWGWYIVTMDLSAQHWFGSTGFGGLELRATRLVRVLVVRIKPELDLELDFSSIHTWNRNQNHSTLVLELKPV
jgi:hypothetical protein